MNLFDILSNDERVIVLSIPGDGVIYTWNRSLMLQCWKREGSLYFIPSFWKHYDNWEEIGVRTLSDNPFHYEHARAAALLWQSAGCPEDGECNQKEQDENSSKRNRSRRKKATRKHYHKP